MPAGTQGGSSRLRPIECGLGGSYRDPPGQASNSRRSASHEVEDDGNHSQYQQNVDEECGDVEYEKASEPQQQQNDSES